VFSFVCYSDSLDFVAEPDVLFLQAKHEDREKIHKMWKQHMRETMDLAMDLMKCVSYDILEEFGCEPAPSEDYRKNDKPLGKIAEEGGAEEGTKGGQGNRVFIIRVDHRIRLVRIFQKLL
jgi:hypothetical protein